MLLIVVYSYYHHNDYYTADPRLKSIHIKCAVGMYLYVRPNNGDAIYNVQQLYKSSLGYQYCFAICRGRKQLRESTAAGNIRLKRVVYYGPSG